MAGLLFNIVIAKTLKEVKASSIDDDLCFALKTNSRRTLAGLQDDMRKEAEASFADDVAYMLDCAGTCLCWLSCDNMWQNVLACANLY